MNKLNWVLILIVLSCVEVKAQFTKGNFMAGGSLSGNYSTSSTTVPNPIVPYTSGFYIPLPNYPADKTNLTITMSPQVGYFIVNNLCIGFKINWTNSNTAVKSNQVNFVSSDDLTQSYFAGGLFVRYYYHKFFVQADYGLGPVNLTSNGEARSVSGSSSIYYSKYEYNNKANVSIGSLSIGRAFLIDKHVAIEPILGYQLTNTKYELRSDDKIGTLFIAVGLQLYINK
jgi:hypothetical protein